MFWPNTHRKPRSDSRIRKGQANKTDMTNTNWCNIGKLEAVQVLLITCIIADLLFGAPGDPQKIPSAFVDVVRRPKRCLREQCI